MVAVLLRESSTLRQKRISKFRLHTEIFLANITSLFSKEDSSIAHDKKIPLSYTICRREDCDMSSQIPYHQRKSQRLQKTGFFLTTISSFRNQHHGYQRIKLLCTKSHGSCQCRSESTKNEATPLNAGHAGRTIGCFGKRIQTIGSCHHAQQVFEALFQEAHTSHFEEDSSWIQQRTQQKYQLLFLGTNQPRFSPLSLCCTLLTMARDTA